MPELTDRLTAALRDRYAIERELGAGGMATVYLARDLKHDRPVALKVLRPELAAVIGAERFLAEIKTTANLQHPHILALYDSGAVYRGIDGSRDRVLGDASEDRSGDPTIRRSLEFLYYVMPYVEGETLRDKLNRETQLGIDEALRITREVADALEYAHRRGVIHRDIKPENILLHDGRALVADFGIALAVSRSDGATRMTETGMSLGTPHYMSPEQAMGEREITARSDVYALGCVLYEMLTGEPPFVGPTAQAVVARVLTEEPRSLTLQRRTVPRHVEAAVRTALAKLPADRFGSAAQFGAALADPAFTAAGAVRQAAATDSHTVLPSYRRAIAAVSVFALVASAVAAWGWVRARGAERQPTTRQYISLGDSVSLVTDYPAMALSPDGSMLVFKDNRQNGLLWVKQRDELEPKPIPGTERAQNPVFSPDNEWVAFVADGRLKKVRPGGGATITLADSVAIGYGGAAWLDDGTLVYVTPTLVALRRVSASGGASTAVSTDTSLSGGGIGHPVPLPGARGVLFQLCSSGCVSISIHVLDLRTGTHKLLLDDVAQAWYLPNGRLLYVRRDGVAMAAPFDLDRLEVTGEAMPVLEDVEARSEGGFALLTWSASGSLVYVRGGGGGRGITVARLRRDGAVAPIDTSWGGEFNSLALAPDGRRAALGVGSGGGLNIWVKQMERGPFTRLTFGNRDRRPAWSPDGHLVAYIRDSANTSAVYARPADGSGPDRLLASIDRMVQEVTWSPDGRWVVVRTDNAVRGAGDLIGVRLDGDSAVPLVASDFSEFHPAISPDGRWLAYTSNESGTNEVYVRPFPNTSAVRWQVSNGGGTSPVWSPTGRELFYLDAAPRLVAAEVQPGSTFGVGRLAPLFDVSGFVNDPFHQGYTVAPDGGSFLFLAPRRLAVAGRAVPIVWVDNWFTDLADRLR